MSLQIAHTAGTPRPYAMIDAMRSKPGVLGPITLLLTLPLAIFGEVLLGVPSQITVHVVLAAGVFLVGFAAFDFDLPRWVALIRQPHFASRRPLRLGRLAEGGRNSTAVPLSASGIGHIAQWQHLGLVPV